MSTSVPDQVKGNEVNVKFSVTASSHAAAKALYDDAAKKLSNVNSWHSYTEPAMSVFQLTDKNGIPLYRQVQEGDLFKINAPVPSSLNGEGFDWVRVEKVEQANTTSNESIAITVRPVPNPVHPDEGTAHFFKDDATSTFKVSRDEFTVTAAVYGRNEVPNIEAESIVDKIRNVAVATGAAIAGSHIQWERLVKGLLGNPDSKN